MSNRESGIEWTDVTWNPVSGCSKVSPGCKFCYAERWFPRAYSRPDGSGKRRKFTDVRCHPDRLAEPLRWRGGRRVFVNSMSDLFHEDVPDEFLDQVYAIMGSTPWNTYQILTKRPQRMLDWYSEHWQPAPEWSQREWHAKWEAMFKDVYGKDGRTFPEFKLDTEGGDRYDQVQMAYQNLNTDEPYSKIYDQDRFWTADGDSQMTVAGWPFKNVHVGVSAENQETLDERLPLLLRTPAAVRFLSCEPLLGPLNLGLMGTAPKGWGHGYVGIHDLLHWVIAGGESGARARPSDTEWFRQIRDECRHTKTPFFLKQLTRAGVKIPFEKWDEDLRVREFPR